MTIGPPYILIQRISALVLSSSASRENSGLVLLFIVWQNLSTCEKCQAVDWMWWNPHSSWAVRFQTPGRMLTILEFFGCLSHDFLQTSLRHRQIWFKGLNILVYKPLCHSRLAESSSGVTPLEGMSAGFSALGKCLQQLIDICPQISITRLWTKGFQDLAIPWIQNKATLELV